VFTCPTTVCKGQILGWILEVSKKTNKQIKKRKPKKKITKKTEPKKN
jgi:hypothetical protein